MSLFAKILFIASGVGLLLFLLTIFILGFFLPEMPIIHYPTQSEHQFVLVEDAKLFYREVPSKDPTYVFLHGFGGSSDNWERLLDYFPNCHLLAFDLLGFGGSDRPSVSYDLQTHQHYISRALEKLELENVILVGYSMGASVAAILAAQHPEQVAGLVLVAPSAFPGSLAFPKPDAYLFRPGLLNRLGQRIVSTVVYRYFFPDSIGMQMLSVTGSYDEDFVHHLPLIRQPTLLLWSEGDRSVPMAYADQYLKFIRSSSLVILPASVGHNFSDAIPIIADEVRAYISNTKLMVF